jgi:hypothetical protein
MRADLRAVYEDLQIVLKDSADLVCSDAGLAESDEGVLESDLGVLHQDGEQLNYDIQNHSRRRGEAHHRRQANGRGNSSRSRELCRTLRHNSQTLLRLLGLGSHIWFEKQRVKNPIDCRLESTGADQSKSEVLRMANRRSGGGSS